MLSARVRSRFIKSSEIMSRQTTVDSLLLSVAAGQPSDSIAIVCTVSLGTIHRCIDVSRYFSRDLYRDTLGKNRDT